MFPLMPSLISGGASLLGSFLNSTSTAANTQAQIAGQQAMQQQSEQFNAQQADIQRQYETQMSNTAYQRSSADMKAAGLNPMMMFGSGGPASTPSGAAATVGTPTMPKVDRPNAFAGIGDAVKAGLGAAVSAKTVDKLSADISNVMADTALTNAKEKLTGAEEETERKRPANVQAATELTDEQAKRQRQQIIQEGPSTMEAAGVLDLPTSYLKRAGQIKWGAGTIDDILAPAVSSALRIKGLGVLRKAFDAREALQGIRR